ncbi:hypothetical protein FOZ63_020227, partial [Perkinsus olseni]
MTEGVLTDLLMRTVNAVHSQCAKNVSKRVSSFMIRNQWHLCSGMAPVNQEGSAPGSAFSPQSDPDRVNFRELMSFVDLNQREMRKGYEKLKRDFDAEHSERVEKERNARLLAQ